MNEVMIDIAGQLIRSIITILEILVVVLLWEIIITYPVFQQEQEQQQESAIATSNNITKVNLAIEELSVSKSPTGLVLVTGTVYNNSTTNVGDVKVNVELFDTNNILMRETTRFVTPPSSTLEPEEREQFNFLIIADRLDHHNVTAYGSISGR
jgi:hypothetical protein